MKDSDAPGEPGLGEPLDATTLGELDRALDARAENLAGRVLLPGEEQAPRRLALAGALALACAAVVAVLWVGGPGSWRLAPTDPSTLEPSAGSRPDPAGDEVPGRDGVPSLAADVSSPHPFVLMPTRDPDITVVWILDSAD